MTFVLKVLYYYNYTIKMLNLALILDLQSNALLNSRMTIITTRHKTLHIELDMFQHDSHSQCRYKALMAELRGTLVNVQLFVWQTFNYNRVLEQSMIMIVKYLEDESH